MSTAIQKPSPEGLESAAARVDRVFAFMFAKPAREWVERIVLVAACVGFLVHLGLVGLARLGWFGLDPEAQLLGNPIAAAYTPFSLILVYEVYLLVYYLPSSTTRYIQKQYEIATLIIVRRLFKDLAAVEITSDWFQNAADLKFTYDVAASVVLFLLLFAFLAIERRKPKPIHIREEDMRPGLRRFITFKKGVSILLAPVLFVLAAYTFVSWTIGALSPSDDLAGRLTDINTLFFYDFFAILIVVDVVLLLGSLFLTDAFHTVMRNSSFIVSTILIRLSFGDEGLVSVVLIVSAVAFGVLMLWIYSFFEKAEVEASPS
ncbi:MAG: hypothetical protein AAGI46_11155 [Planctomycetota bacterium]